MTSGPATDIIEAALKHLADRPGFSLLRWNGDEDEHMASLPLEDAERSAALTALRSLRRTARLAQTHEDDHEGLQMALALTRRGLTSAHRIAAMSRRRFLRDHGDIAPEAPHRLGEIHARATDVKARAQFAFAAAHDLAGAARFRASRFYNADPGIASAFQAMPSFGELFGQFQFCACEHCRSVISPAAYFVDVMRVIDERVTEANAATIPSKCRLSERRPDLFSLKLDCENTNTPRPILELLNAAVEETLAATFGAPDADAAMAAAIYPFNLPFNAPLAQARGFLGGMRASLGNIYAQMARSIAQGQPAAATADSLSFAEDLGGVGPDLRIEITAGPGFGQARRIVAYGPESPTVKISPPWTTIPDVESSFRIYDPGPVVREALGLSREEADFLTTPAPERMQEAYGADTPPTFAVFPDLGPRLELTQGGRTATVATGPVFVGSQFLADGEVALVAAPGAQAGQVILAEAWPLASQTATLVGEDPMDSCSFQAAAGEAGFTDPTLQLGVGCRVQTPRQARTIVSVAPGGVYGLESPWAEDETVAQIMFRPAEWWDDADWFMRAIGSDPRDLQALLAQDLSIEERVPAAPGWSGADSLFINASWLEDPRLPPLHTVADPADPNRPQIRVQGLSLARLDRLSRFVRLARRVGISYADLDAALRGFTDGLRGEGGVSIVSGSTTLEGRDTTFDRDLLPGVRVVVGGQARVVVSVQSPTALTVDQPWLGDEGQAPYRFGPFEITDAFLEHLAKVRALSAQLGLSIPLTCALWSNLRTSGRVRDDAPEDPFDAIFNAPGLTPSTAAPFDPLKPVSWTIAGTSPGDVTVRARLRGALQVTDDDLTVLAGFIAKLTDGAGLLLLNVQTLSRLWRHAELARQCGLPPADYLALLAAAIGEAPGPARASDWLEGSADQVRAVLDAAAWLKASGLRTADVAYLATGEAPVGWTPPYVPEQTASLAHALFDAASGALLTVDSFIGEAVNQTESGAIFQALIAASYLTPSGAVALRSIPFLPVSTSLPMTAKDLETGPLSVSDAEAAFAALLTASPPILEPVAPAGAAVMGRSYRPQSPLDFLFIGDPAATEKRAAVSTRLSAQFEAILAEAVRCKLASLKLASDPSADAARLIAAALRSQDALVVSGIATRFGVSEPALRGGLGVLTGAADAAWLLADLLSPHASDYVPPDELARLLSTLARISLMAHRLGLSASELNALAAIPQSLNIHHLDAPTLADLMQLSRFKQAALLVAGGSSALARYLMAPSDMATPDRLNRLARLAGWPEEQAAALAQVFWPPPPSSPADGPPSDGPQTLAGILRLAAAFQLARRLGGDAATLLAYARTASLGPLPDPTVWSAYLAMAEQAHAQFAGLQSGDARLSALKPITDAYETTRRDALVGYAASVIHQAVPSVQGPDDLYGYLLIDVKTCACDNVSPIAQGIASIQLYLQRAWLNLEPGVTLTEDDIPATWWRWLMAYRLWEANRRIFLYPENYLDPAVRSTASETFRSMSDTLLQGQVTESAAQRAFGNYLQELGDLASLVHCAGCLERAFDGTKQADVDTLHVFARTQDAPQTYFCRDATLGVDDVGGPVVAGWSNWSKVPTKIEAPVVSPLSAMGRLFVFWSDLATHTGTSTLAAAGGQAATPWAVTSATLKYAYRNAAGEWSQPQIIASDINLGADNAALQPGATASLAASSYQAPWAIPFKVDQQGHAADGVAIVYGQGHYVGAPFNPFGSPSAIPAGPDPLFKALRTLNQANPVGTGDTNVYCVVAPHFILDRALNVHPARYVFPTDVSRGYPSLIVNDARTDWQPPPLQTTSLRMLQTPAVAVTNYLDNNLAGRLSAVPKATGHSQVTGLLGQIDGARSAVAAIANGTDKWIVDPGDEQFLVMVTGAPPAPPLASVIQPTWTSRDDAGVDHYTVAMGGTGSTSTLAAFARLSTTAPRALRHAFVSDGADAVLTCANQRAPEIAFSRYGPTSMVVAAPLDVVDFKGAFGGYYWELFFHAPFLIADQLRAAGRFEQAKHWYEYIFNPTQPETQDDPGLARFWRFLPFRITMESLIADLNDDAQIAAYEAQPFDPDAVARLRPSAYAKAVVMQYVGNLLDWADALFRQDTRETIAQATLLYTLASEILGPRPPTAEVARAVPAASFADIQRAYGGDIPEFLIYLEDRMTRRPASCRSLIGEPPTSDIGAYFCVPENAELLAWWDRVDDRLYKIRHCMNIDGAARSLAQFAAPIDPRAVIAAQPALGTLPSGAGLQGPLPAYRYAALSERARLLASTVTQFGAALLDAMQKRDAEALAQLQAAQAGVILGMTTSVRENQIEDLKQLGDALTASQNAASDRRTHYQDLISKGLHRGEIAQLVLSGFALRETLVEGLGFGVAAISSLVPSVGSVFAMVYGGREVGPAAANVAMASGALASAETEAGQLALNVAGYDRREDEWAFQRDQAKRDGEQIAAQIKANDALLAIARQELEIHKTTIAQNETLCAFLADKHTNTELYGWLIKRLTTLYGQIWATALDMALQAQRAFQYETGSTRQFVRASAWDEARAGLLAGEGLLVALAQMEKAFLDANFRRLEIEKTVALSKIDSKALANLQQNQAAAFDFPLAIFQDDYPGHFDRRIKSITVSIPAVVGPYQNLVGTLTQTSSQVLLRADPEGVRGLYGLTDATPGPDVLRSSWWANQKIAISRGSEEAGVFVLDFADERYLPFEGTGAQSHWSLKLGGDIGPAISDVIFRIRYTALDGGPAFADAARAAAKEAARRPRRAAEPVA